MFCKKFGWNDEGIKFLATIKETHVETASDSMESLSTISEEQVLEKDVESPDRDMQVYIPEQINPKLEAAYIRFCRFSRTLVLRNFEEFITSVDFKAYCGDLLLSDAITVLEQFDYNVVDACNYLYDNDLRHPWEDGRLDKEKLRIFENYVLQNGFDSEVTKAIKFDNKLYGVSSRKKNKKSAMIYLFNFYQSWKRTYDGSKIMEEYYREQNDTLEINKPGIEFEFMDVPILCQYCEKAEFYAGKTNKIMCPKCYDFLNHVDVLLILNHVKAIMLAPVEFRWNQAECYESLIPPRRRQESRNRRRSVMSCREYGWNDEKASELLEFLTAIEEECCLMKDDESPDRDVQVYIPEQINPKLEAAYIRFCRFSRTLVLRNFEQFITSVDFKALCGDLLVSDAITVLDQCDYNVVDACNYLYDNDLRHPWEDGRLDKEKLRIFENYVLQNGFEPALTRVINFDYRRRNASSSQEKDSKKSAIIYLFNYYQSWKRTHNGSKIMEKYYRNGPKEITNGIIAAKELCIESKFMNVAILCQYCEKTEFYAGKKNKIMCPKCYDFFKAVDAVRSVSINEAVTLAPIDFKWNRFECYEPEMSRKAKRSRERRTRSLKTSHEFFWSNAQAKKFGKYVTSLKKKRLRAENCRSNIF